VDISKDLPDKELGLKYPCNWEYKIIADAKDDLRKSIDTLLKNRNYKFEFSKIYALITGI